MPGIDETPPPAKDAQLPSTLARDTEVAAAVSAHEAASDPHVGYQKESEISVPGLIVPDACLYQDGGDAPWYAANFVLFHRFYLPVKASFRYINVFIGTSSGNIEVCVVALSGANRLTFTKTGLDSGKIASPGTDEQRIDCGGGSAVALNPGDYALGFWADNTAIHVPVTSANSIGSSRLTCNYNAGSGGVPNSATCPAWSSRFMTGLSLEANV